jgi:4-diphosphocytidyl-2-C-methyl-D-erythritol kinase
MAAPTTTLHAPAKLTLSLRITGVRADGYHLIDAEMVTLDLADRLVVSDGSGVEFAGVGFAGGEGPDGPLAVPVSGEDLVTRALALAGRVAHVRVEKRIPPGAGLGGGSADAAAILRWAGFRDLVAASVLGADIPFCLIGGRARVSGIGEVVHPLAFEARTLTLLTPPFGCRTPDVYRAWDRIGGPMADDVSGNDLEVAALAVEPRLAHYRDVLAEASGQRPRLAGSGSTWFVDGAHPGEGRRVVRTVPASA